MKITKLTKLTKLMDSAKKFFKPITIDLESLNLYAPLSYWDAPNAIKDRICNGCGAKDGLDVPDTMYGLDITEACKIHDWMYQQGETLADKIFADAMFRLNLSMIIDKYSSGIMAYLRHGRASHYYFAVVEFGNSAYWINKQKNEYMNITFKGEFK